MHGVVTRFTCCTDRWNVPSVPAVWIYIGSLSATNKVDSTHWTELVIFELWKLVQIRISSAM